MLLFILNAILIAVALYCTWSVAYQFIFALAARFKKAPNPSNNATCKQTTFAVIIPAYKEDKVILETAQKALKQQYPKDKFDVFVIADQLKETTLFSLQQLPIRVEEVNFKNSSKARALNWLLSKIRPHQYDAVVILDADNIMKPNFLNQINRDIQNGKLAIQGCRAAKNEDTPMAILDGASEAANNMILGKGPNALGLSGRLAGSGMAFNFELFRYIMKDIDAFSGFDKELELRLIQAGIFIHYNQQAIIYDEKVRNTDNFTRQRGRWIAAQYQHFSTFFLSAIIDLVSNGNYDFFNKTVQMALPPRLLLPVFLAMMTVIGLVFQIGGYVWLSLLTLNIATYLLALPTSFWSWQSVKAFSFLPKAIWATLSALLLIPEAKKRFLHTNHG